MSKVAQFIDRYSGDGSDLQRVLDDMSERLGQSSDSLLSAALADRFAACHILIQMKRLHSRQNRG